MSPTTLECTSERKELVEIDEHCPRRPYVELRVQFLLFISRQSLVTRDGLQLRGHRIPYSGRMLNALMDVLTLILQVYKFARTGEPTKSFTNKLIPGTAIRKESTDCGSRLYVLVTLFNSFHALTIVAG